MVSDLLKSVLTIVRKGSSFGRFRLVRAYFRITLKKAFLVDLAGRKIKTESLWGQVIHFSDYNSFATLFQQVYVSDDYFFKSRNSSPRVIDCGANIGMTIAYILAHYPQARILAFEADPANYKILQMNRDRNQWQNVEIFNLALDSKQGYTSFYSGGAGSMVGSLRGEPSSASGVSVIEVETAQLSSFINDRVDFIKMDIEGAEQAVLDDLIQTNAIAAVQELVIEYHHQLQPGENRLGQFLSGLEGAHFAYHVKAPWKTPFSAASEPQYLMIGAYRDSAGDCPRALAEPHEARDRNSAFYVHGAESLLPHPGNSSLLN